MKVQVVEQAGMAQKGQASEAEQTGRHDDLLVGEAKKGSSAAFGALFERYHRKMFQVVMRVLRHHEDAEDAVQQAFKSAFVHLASFQGHSRFSTWLTRIAINEALMLRRKRRSLHLPLENDIEGEDEKIRIEIEDASATPEERCGAKELQSVLLEAISELRPALRKVVQLREISELSTEKTAKALEVTGGTVKSRMFRARLALREKLTTRLESRGRRAAQRLFFESRNAGGRAQLSGSLARAV